MSFQEEWDEMNKNYREEVRALREYFFKKRDEIEEKYRKIREDLQKSQVTPIVRVGIPMDSLGGIKTDHHE